MQAGRRVVGSYGPREKAPCPLRDWTRAQHDRLHTSIQSLQSAKKRRTHQGKGVNALAPNWPSTLRWLFVAQDRDVCLNIDLVGKGKVVNLRFRGNANRVPSKNKASGCTPINSDNMRWGADSQSINSARCWSQRKTRIPGHSCNCWVSKMMAHIQKTSKCKTRQGRMELSRKPRLI